MYWTQWWVFFPKKEVSCVLNALRRVRNNKFTNNFTIINSSHGKKNQRAHAYYLCLSWPQLQFPAQMERIFYFWYHRQAPAIGCYYSISSKNWWIVAILLQQSLVDRLIISAHRIIRRFWLIHHWIWISIVSFLLFFYHGEAKKRLHQFVVLRKVDDLLASKLFITYSLLILYFRLNFPNFFLNYCANSIFFGNYIHEERQTARKVQYSK